MLSLLLISRAVQTCRWVADIETSQILQTSQASQNYRLYGTSETYRHTDKPAITDKPDKPKLQTLQTSQILQTSKNYRLYRQARHTDIQTSQTIQASQTSQNYRLNRQA